ncbi:hypothetical protein GQ457_11G007490 [Hibiscus cannabinus]
MKGDERNEEGSVSRTLFSSFVVGGRGLPLNRNEERGRELVQQLALLPTSYRLLSKLPFVRSGNSDRYV